MKTRSVLSTLQINPQEFSAGTRDTTEFLVSCQLTDDNLDEDTPLQANIGERSSVVAPEPADWTPITPGDVQYYIDTVKRHKAPGPDGIFPDVYRKMSEKISPYLAKLYTYTECLKTGTFLAPWKRGRLVILHKSPEKDPKLPKSYRPINLLDVGGKVFEKVLKDLTSEALSTPLAPEQFGFMQGKCTTDAILTSLPSKAASLAKRDYSLTPEKQRILYKGIFEGIALYACGVWAHRILLKTYATVLLRAQRTALVKLFGAYTDTSLEALTLILDEPPAHLTALFRAAKYVSTSKQTGRTCLTSSLTITQICTRVNVRKNSFRCGTHGPGNLPREHSQSFVLVVCSEIYKRKIKKLPLSA